MGLVMGPLRRRQAAAGRACVRRLCVVAALMLSTSGVNANGVSEPRIDVAETRGVYKVTAAFTVTQAPRTVIDVLTDYDRIPDFMPDVEVSKVLERTAGGAVVEQEAVSKFMMFSKRVHLVLDVRENGGVIRFSDICGKSFVSYDGTWTISARDGITVIDYELTAKPSFEVPGFVLKRLLKRDAAQLIDRLKAEITARENRRK